MREPKDIIIKGKTLEEILDAHKHWLNEDINGWEDMMANLREADLCYANLCYANLRGADQRGADLRGADLRYANLCYANLRGADLRGADLCRANLRGTDLRGVDLRGADLRGADLCGAKLCGANLCGADLCGADLRRANLRGAALCGANLRDAKNLPYIPLSCPSYGSFIGWKKCRNHGANNNEVIVKLEIPEDAMRSSATGRKCRASKAIVLEIQDIEGNKIDSKAYSTYEQNQDFEYIVGETVEPREPFNENRYEECASGIHFFIDRQEAVDY